MGEVVGTFQQRQQLEAQWSGVTEEGLDPSGLREADSPTRRSRPRVSRVTVDTVRTAGSRSDG